MRSCRHHPYLPDLISTIFSEHWDTGWPEPLSSCIGLFFNGYGQGSEEWGYTFRGGHCPNHHCPWAVRAALAAVSVRSNRSLSITKLRGAHDMSPGCLPPLSGSSKEDREVQLYPSCIEKVADFIFFKQYLKTHKPNKL